MLKTSLSRNERPYYIMAMRQSDLDPELYLTGQQLEFPAEHFGEVVYAFTNPDALLRILREVGNGNTVEKSEAKRYIQISVDICAKMARQINQREQSDRALQSMNDLMKFSEAIPGGDYSDHASEFYDQFDVDTIDQYAVLYFRSYAANMLKSVTDTVITKIDLVELERGPSKIPDSLGGEL